MFEAKALTGEKAGELIYAKDPRLTHELCKLWKIYCPECKQFLYFSKSKNPDKRRSYFGHYDYEDKHCPERSFAVNQGNQVESFSESHDQDRETTELFVEQVFYSINSEYFQNLRQRNNERSSQKVKDEINWFTASLSSDCKNWIKNYCQKTGFLDWKNPEKEISYLMDWLYVLSRREDILENLILYFFLHRKPSRRKDIFPAKHRFGISKDQLNSSSSTWVVILGKILDVLARLAKNEIIVSPKILLKTKLLSKSGKVRFKGKIIYTIFGRQMSALVKKSREYSDYILFNENYSDCFCYKRRLNDSPSSEKLNFSQNTSMLLYIDEDGDLAVKGLIEKEYSKLAIKGIMKILFNTSGYSILVFLRERFISNQVAGKAAQLALSIGYVGYEDLLPLAALLKFRELSSKY